VPCAAAGAVYEEQIGSRWAQDNSEKLPKDAYEENYELAIQEFTSERLQSYYLKESQAAIQQANAGLAAVGPIRDGGQKSVWRATYGFLTYRPSKAQRVGESRCGTASCTPRGGLTPNLAGSSRNRS
jgi:hypothetical protein